MADKKKFEDDRPGMDQKRKVDNEDYDQTRKSAETGNQGRAAFNAGSTTQGGSNHGQGSKALGGESYRQGEQKNAGANYSDEAGKLSSEEPIGGRTPGAATGGETSSRLKAQNEGKAAGKNVPHGEGAHHNEEERNAQEDYPGPNTNNKDTPPSSKL
ncbi:MAG TPA: hypothetical protein VL093_08045 [Flavipsychrobacter sp.]|nr:hypothetical protein [Flavipsychrobacter sp.]